jgi:hypothetical protein
MFFFLEQDKKENNLTLREFRSLSLDGEISDAGRIRSQLGTMDIITGAH